MKNPKHYNPAIHHRRSIRLKGYNYAKEGMYFVTLCCEAKRKLFGEVIEGEMILNTSGQIIHTEWEQTAKIRNNIELHDFIVMPDHFHAIIEIIENKGNSELIDQKNAPATFSSPKQTLGSIIRGFKGASSKRLKEFYFKGDKKDLDTGELLFAPTGESPIDRTGELQFAPSEALFALSDKIWQRNYYESIIFDQEAYFRISKYIRNNPIKWHLDKLAKK